MSEGLDCSIAYRHIDKNPKGTGKSNIDFAAEAFKEIEQRKNCYAVGLDIKKFFDTLDWSILKKKVKYIDGRNCYIVYKKEEKQYVRK